MDTMRHKSTVTRDSDALWKILMMKTRPNSHPKNHKPIWLVVRTCYNIKLKLKSELKEPIMYTI